MEYLPSRDSHIGLSPQAQERLDAMQKDEPAWREDQRTPLQRHDEAMGHAMGRLAAQGWGETYPPERPSPDEVTVTAEGQQPNL